MMSKNYQPRFLALGCLCLFLFTFSNPSRVKACDRSSLTLDSVTPAPGGTYYIYLRLCVGAGILGLTKGADGNTGRFLFSFSSSTPGFDVISFPTSIQSDFTGMNYNGQSVGPVAPFNATEGIFYNNSTNWFACITSTVSCGAVNTECDQLRFQVNALPDSIRIYGIEGGDNLFGGCYPNLSMLIDFSNLPVTYQHFQGYPANGGIELEWATLVEYNNRGFEVQRSIDGIGYQSIGQVDAEAAQTKVGAYQYFDPSPHQGFNYYRLVQHDVNGAQSTSEAIAVEYAAASKLEWQSVGPIPADDRVEVRFRTPDSGIVTLHLRDLQGRVLENREWDASEGVHSLELSTQAIPSGVYFIDLQQGKERLKKKIVIL